MRRFKVIAACFLAAGIAMSGCAVGAAEQQSQEVLYSIAPVDNSPEAIKNCNRPAGQGVLMSFDDQGTKEQVHAILDKLRQHHMRAAFFPTGIWAMENFELIIRMREEGHIVGNHTHTHKDLGELSAHDEAGFYGEIYPLKDTANTNPMLLRPPYEAGAYDPLVRQRLTDKDIQSCTWTADTRDWKGGTVDQMMNLLKNGDEYIPPLGEDGVILAHMQGQHSPALIDAIIQYLGEKGWAYERTA